MNKVLIDNFNKYLQQYELIEISLITYYEIVGGLLAKNALKQLKGTPNNSILFPNLGFFPATALPKYSFSDAKLRFWCLVSKKNTCVGIPKGINRGALNIFEDFVSVNIVIPMTDNSAKISAELYSSLRQGGDIVDDIDLLIAGIAIDNDMTLITNNENHFSRIPGLRIDNWSKYKV